MAMYLHEEVEEDEAPCCCLRRALVCNAPIPLLPTVVELDADDVVTYLLICVIFGVVVELLFSFTR